MLRQGTIADKIIECLENEGVQYIFECDCLITVGFDHAEFPPERWADMSFSLTKIIIHIDTKPSEVSSLFSPKFEIIGSIRKTLSSLLELFRRSGEKPFSVGQFQKARNLVMQSFSEYAHENQEGKQNPRKILYDIRRCIPEDGVLISDVGQHMLFITRFYQCHNPKTCITPAVFAPMGFSLPAGIGHKLVNPTTPVVIVIGDGCLLMNCQEMETAKRLGLKGFVMIVFVDSQYGMIRFEQEREHKTSTFVDFSNPNFVKMADSFGWKGRRIDKTAEFAVVLQQSLKEDCPVLIECPIDYVTRNKDLSSA